MSDMREFNKQVKSLMLLTRNNLGLSQAKAGERIGVAQGTWRDWEAGRSKIPAFYYQKVLELSKQSVKD